MGEDRHRKVSACERVVEQHLRHLVLLCVLLRVLIASLALLASYLPAFDSSADILLQDKNSSLPKRWIAVSLRWDTFHFLHIAQAYYLFEHEWAFLPGVPVVLRITGCIIDLLTRNVGDSSAYGMLLGHFFISTVVTCETTRTLYLLTMQHTQSSALSLLSGYLSLLSSSPATLHLAPYAEPWFALFSYKGMLYCAQKRWLFASVSFALAGMFRSNGIILGGFIIWGLIVEPLIIYQRIKLQTIIVCILLSVLLSLPFVTYQLSGYLTFCVHPTSITPSWCTRHLPLIYTHVQSHYWNVGFLRYWTMQQLPNFIISAPILLLLLFSSITYILHVVPLLLTSSLNYKSVPPQPLLTPSLLPHAIHAIIITCMLLFASHTQIILRLASSMPFTYWSAARLFFEHPKWAKAWIAWSVAWGATSVVLWVAFLPPA